MELYRTVDLIKELLAALHFLGCIPDADSLSLHAFPQLVCKPFVSVAVADETRMELNYVAGFDKRRKVVTKNPRKSETLKKPLRAIIAKSIKAFHSDGRRRAMIDSVEPSACLQLHVGKNSLSHLSLTKICEVKI